MAAKTINLEDAKGVNLALVEDAERGTQAVHDVVVAMQANRRTGSANTKTRGEVAATGKKPFRQKGTGRARQGGNASPIHRGGGVVFGPRPRDYSKKVTRNARKLALAKVLSERIAAEDILSVPDFSVPDGKTKSFVAKVKSAAGDARNVLVVAPEHDESTKRAGRNVQFVQLATAAEANVEQFLRYEKIILVDGALEALAARTRR